MTDTETETKPTFPTTPWEGTSIKVDDDASYGGQYEAAVWDNIGDLVCCVTTQMAGNGTIEHAKDRARLIAAAGTAAHDLPDEYDAVEAVKALPELIEAVQEAWFFLDGFKAGISHEVPCEQEIEDLDETLNDALQKARKDQ